MMGDLIFQGKPLMIDAYPVKDNDPWQNNAYIPMGRQETSRQAALDFAPRAIPLRTKILTAIKASHDRGYTDAELLKTFWDYSPNSIRPRRIDLVRQGKVRNSGRVRNGSIVWVAP